MDKISSFLSIIQHIQNNLSDIIRDHLNSNKNLKLKVNDIKGESFIYLDTLKILNVKLTPYINEENKYFEKFQGEIDNFKTDLEHQKKIMEIQIKNLKQENHELFIELDKLRNEIIHEDRIKEHKPEQELNEIRVRKTEYDYCCKNVKSQEELANYKINFEQIISILREEEKNKINLEKEISNLKNMTFDIKGEINIISNKYEKKCQDYDLIDKINIG